MATEIDQLHVLFFPLMAQGHILPTIDMVRLFTARGVKTSIITTTHNAQYFTKTIEKTQNSPTEISLKVIEFPAKQAGLPEGFENLDLVSNQEHHHKFFDALSLLQHPLSNLMQELRPHAVVADMFFPWATALASKYGVPRLIFHGTSFFSMCAMGSIIQYNPHKIVSSDNEKFVLPGLPVENATRGSYTARTRERFYKVGVVSDYDLLALDSISGCCLKQNSADCLW